jgi:uncharacterized membrane protein
VNGLAAVDWVQVGELVGLMLAVFGGTAVGVSRVVQAKLAETLKPVVVEVAQEVLPPLVAPLVATETYALSAAVDDVRQRVARLEGASGALATVMGAREAGGPQAA